MATTVCVAIGVLVLFLFSSESNGSHYDRESDGPLEKHRHFSVLLHSLQSLSWRPVIRSRKSLEFKVPYNWGYIPPVCQALGLVLISKR